MSYRKNHSEREFLFEETKDISSSSTFKSSPLKDDKYFILHHTAGRGTAMDVMNVLNTRHLGVQWIIDRDGKLYKSLPSGHRGAHIKMIRPSVPKDLSNRTTQGVEIIAKDDTDISEIQCKTALKLIKSLGYPLSNVYGHGEVSRNRGPEEGKTCKAYIKKNWNSPDSKSSDLSSVTDKFNTGTKDVLSKLSNLDLSKMASGGGDSLSKLLSGVFSENKSSKSLDLLIEKSLQNAIKSKISEDKRILNSVRKNLNEIDLMGFPQGNVDSNKVLTGGVNGVWDGSLPKALEVAKIAKNCTKNEDIIISQKRSRVKTASGNVSDHYVKNLSAYAIDIKASGKKGDELLACIMKKWDGGSNSDYKGGKWLNVKKDGYRYQFGWNVPDHYDHIHVGVKKIGTDKSNVLPNKNDKDLKTPDFDNLADSLKDKLKDFFSNFSF